MRPFRASISLGSVAAWGMARVYQLAVSPAPQKTATEALNRYVRIEGALNATPVNPFQQHRQLGTRQVDCAMGGLRPHEASTLQALRKQTQSIPGPPQDLHPVPEPNNIV